jgi:hypothetical protein
MSDKDLALTACDDSLKENIQKIAGVLFQNLASATDDADKNKAKDAFKRGMHLCKDVHDISRQTVNVIFS